ncbi:MAG TPA: SRPBCC domain-containing protein [Pilimelia sp.]|nr:SRPBCC domain-containing protein [Pilimelia sp.]
MKADLVVEAVYGHPVERVWAALTSAEALAAWLMPNDFAPRVGHEFTFRTEPAPGFDGVVRCRVLELAPPTRMVWSWAGGPIDTTVTFALTPLADARTALHVRQFGFRGLGGQFTRLVLLRGSRQIYRRRLPAYLAGRPLPDPHAGHRHWPPHWLSGRRR